MKVAPIATLADIHFNAEHAELAYDLTVSGKPWLCMYMFVTLVGL